MGLRNYPIQPARSLQASLVKTQDVYAPFVEKENTMTLPEVSSLSISFFEQDDLAFEALWTAFLAYYGTALPPIDRFPSEVRSPLITRQSKTQLSRWQKSM